MIGRNDPSNGFDSASEQQRLVDSERNECAAIFNKYDAAKADVQYDDEETFQLYRRTDRHGFTHDQRFEADFYEDEKAKARELRRERKWLKMLQRWSKYEHSIKLKRSVYKGVPQKFRAEVWRRLLNIDGQKMLGLYERLLIKARQCAKDAKQIDLDINRTYRNHIFYRQRYGFKQRSLLNVLSAYSLFNRELGYCQGMNHLAALLLMYFVEEDAFWALHILMCDNGHAMHGLFMPGFPKLLRLQQHHDMVLKKQLPRLKAHLDGQGIHSGLYTTKWFFQCFLHRVPFSLALRLWDIFMLEGDLLLTVGAFAILKLHERHLLRMNFEQTMEFLQVKLEKSFGFSNDAVVQALQKATATLARKKLLRALGPTRPEMPTEPMGTIVLHKAYGGDARTVPSNRFSATHRPGDGDTLSTSSVRTTPDSDQLDDLLNVIYKAGDNDPYAETNPQNNALPHVSSYYDNLQENFCCSSAGELSSPSLCKHGASMSSIAGRAGSFRIEFGSDYITRIRIDAP